MSPDVTTFHLRNQAATNPEIGCDQATSIACRAAPTDFQHQFVGKFCHAISLAATMKHHARLLWSTTFHIPVNSIVNSCTGEEMSRVTARAIVAPVENKGQVIRYLPVVRQRVGNTVRSGDGAVVAGTGIEPAVPLMAEKSLPFPAGIRTAAHIDARPKADELFWGKINTHVTAFRDVPRRRVFSAPLRLSVLCSQLYQMGASS